MIVTSGMAAPFVRALALCASAATSASRPLRIGSLGSSKIVKTALIRPSLEAWLRPHVIVVAVASGTLANARALIEDEGITDARAIADFNELVAATDIDCVYIALPNGLHHEWAMRSMIAGKHVIVEKALAPSAAQAAQLVHLARQQHVVLMEGLAYVHHPLAARMRAVFSSGVLGVPQSIHGEFPVSATKYNQRGSRYNSTMSGGATADLGGYVMSVIFVLTGAWPRVLSARADRWKGDSLIDEAMRGTFMAADHLLGTFSWSLREKTTRSKLTVRGTHGELHATNFQSPHAGGGFSVSPATNEDARTPSNPARKQYIMGSRLEKRSSYAMQLEAFCRLVSTPANERNFTATVGLQASTGEAPWRLAKVLDDVYAKSLMRTPTLAQLAVSRRDLRSVTTALQGADAMAVCDGFAPAPPIWPELSAELPAVLRRPCREEEWPARHQQAPPCKSNFSDNWSARQFQQLHEHGYMMLRGLVAPPLLHAVDEVLRRVNITWLPAVHGSHVESQPHRLKGELSKMRPPVLPGSNPQTKSVWVRSQQLQLETEALLEQMAGVFYVACQVLLSVKTTMAEGTPYRRWLVENGTTIFVHVNSNLPGSIYQNPHVDAIDASRLSRDAATAATSGNELTIDVPLVDVHSALQGPIELWPGSQRIPFGRLMPRPCQFSKMSGHDRQYLQCFPFVNARMGTMPSVLPLTSTGDALVRWPFTWHRGTPNRSPQARTMLTFIFQRKRMPGLKEHGCSRSSSAARGAAQKGAQQMSPNPIPVPPAAQNLGTGAKRDTPSTSADTASDFSDMTEPVYKKAKIVDMQTKFKNFMLTEMGVTDGFASSVSAEIVKRATDTNAFHPFARKMFMEE